MFSVFLFHTFNLTKTPVAHTRKECYNDNKKGVLIIQADISGR